MKYLIALLAVLLIGCTVGSPDHFPDANIVYDAGPAFVGEGPPCQPALLDRDIHHCGACGHYCPPADTDRCVESVCQCGDGPPCTGLADCRVGRCIETDPEGRVCEFDDECYDGFACIVGRCTFVDCVPEVCDGYDNDCDGEVDNNGPSPLAEYCWSGGDPAEPIMLPCRRGIRTCISGAWTECIDEIAPVEEVGILGCDGLDNDCDGCVDGVVDEAGMCESREPVAFDVLFVIDQSGSMADNIAIVRQAVRLFSSRLSFDPAFRWGIIRVPETGADIMRAELYQDLTTFAVFAPVLDAMTTGFGGTEPQWDAVYEATSGELGVSWRPGSVRLVVLFTDEEGQSTRAARSLSPVDERGMCEAMTHGEVFIPVVSDTVLSDFDDCMHSMILLPSGAAGSGDTCVRTEECMDEETCEAAVCVTRVVVETAAALDTVIGDPCVSE